MYAFPVWQAPARGPLGMLRLREICGVLLVWHGPLGQELPDSDERFINIRDLEEGIGVLSSLLLRKDVYRSMVGGDGACQRRADQPDADQGGD